MLVQECDALCAAVHRDVGKTPAEVLGSEVLPTADACRFLLRQAPRSCGRAGCRRGSVRCGCGDKPTSSTVGRAAWWGSLGRGIIPLFLNAVQILQALLAGNAVVWKPSELTSHFAPLLHQLLLQAGFPPAVVQMLPATREMGPVLAEAAVDHVVFTGSAAVGRKLAARLGERLISSTMELSGCDAQFVLADADVALAARAAWFGCTINRGQTCIAVRRAFVHRTLYSPFCEALRALADGAPAAPLLMPSQVQQARRLLADALGAGARLLNEAAPGETGACRPMIVIDATPEMALCREPAFAPVMAVLPFDSVEEALRQESICPFALGASIFTRRQGPCGMAGRPAARGLGDGQRRGGADGPSVHAVRRPGRQRLGRHARRRGAAGDDRSADGEHPAGAFRPHYDAADAGKLASQEELLRGLLQATHASGIGSRLRGWGRLIRAAWRGS